MNKDAHALEAILDNCITAVLDEGQPVTMCLHQYPDQQEVLEPLLQLTVRLQAARSLQPAPEFRQVAATRMHNLLAAHPHRQPSGSSKAMRWSDWRTLFTTRRRSAWAGLAGFVMIFCLLIGSVTVSAAAGTIPGNTLYPVKLAVEQSQIALTFNELKAAQHHLRFADRRLQETADLLATNQDQLAADTISAYKMEIAAATTLLDTDNSPLTFYEQQLLAQMVADDLNKQERQLTMWQGSLPEGMETAVSDALTSSQESRRQALFILGEAPDPSLPTSTSTPPATSTTILTRTPLSSSTAAATAVPSATPLPTTPAPMPTPEPVPVLPPDWPDTCPDPLDWPDTWPDDCPIPTIRPTAWPPPVGGESTATSSPIPTTTPFPTAPPIPTIVLPPGWPADCPFPPDTTGGWPDSCPDPSDWDSGWPTPVGGWPTPDISIPTPDDSLPTPPPPPTPPDVPEPPDIPEPPDLPEPPDIPEPPDLPDMPDIPEIPDLPEPPDLPDDFPTPPGGEWPSWP